MVKTTHLCTFGDCKMLKCKIQCIKKGIHNHGKSDQEHIKLQQDQQNLPQAEIHRQTKQIQCIKEGIHDHGKADQKHIKLYQEIQQDQQNLPQVQNDKNIKPIDLSKREYKVKVMDIDSSESYVIAHISNNEKYLAFECQQKILKIYDFKELKINGYIKACQFSFHSSQLYVALWNYDLSLNIIIGFDVEKNFKNIQYCIITAIQESYLITYDSVKICKIDVKKNKQIFNVIDGNISTIDYNQQYDVIITGGNSIKLWDFGKRSVIIKQERTHHTCILLNIIQQYRNCIKFRLQMQLIEVKYRFIKLQEYQDPNGIYSFSSINQNQNLLLISERDVKIIDDKGQTLKQIVYQCGKDYKYCFQLHLVSFERMNSRQLDNAKYIIIHVNAYQGRCESFQIILLSALE